jgi:hypothetical protein
LSLFRISDFGFRILPFLLLGCGSARQDILETELRQREFQVRDLKSDLAKAQHVNHALLHENAILRHGVPIAPEVAAQTFTLKRIVLGRLTGGIDKDGAPGDDGLEVYVEPRDGEDHPIKAPGSLHVQALEITTEGVKIPIGAWEIGPEQLRTSWKTGLFSTGYAVTLPWQTCPSSSSVRVVARLLLSDGRMFEAERDVRIRPRPAEGPLPPPRIDAGPALPLPPPKIEPSAPMRPLPFPPAPKAAPAPPPSFPLTPVTPIEWRATRGQ